MANYDFLLERNLKQHNRDLAYRYTCCTALFEQVLKKFLANFPTFPDHSLLHTLSVTNITNQLLRQEVEKLNAGEIYTYLMAAALHDIGMGVSDKDLPAFIDAAGLRDYVAAHPEVSKPTLIRKFHNDFSAAFVRKYWELLEIPPERYVYAIAEDGRGHRKTDLLDEALYPTDYDLGDGNKANLAVLAAVIRLADELDVASDRNPDLLYNTAGMEGMTEKDVMEFSKHDAIHTVEFLEDTIRICADTDEAAIRAGVIEGVQTVRSTMDYCLSVMEQRGTLRLGCQKIQLVLNGETVAL